MEQHIPPFITASLRYIGATPTVRHPRPIQVYYYRSAKDSTEDWAKKSRACTVRGAARAAFMRVWDREFNHVDIYEEDGLWVGFIHREKNGSITAKIAVKKGE